LLASISVLRFREARYREYTAKRRVVSYGADYDFGAQELRSAPPIPGFLESVRSKAASWLGVSSDAFVHALVTEYRPGTPLGWHRDRPEFGLVTGISLAAPCRMRWRQSPSARTSRSLVLDLEPRSAYAMQGDARWRWQHAIAPTKALRYSITFRTLRSVP